MEIQKLMELCEDDFEKVLTISAKYGLGLEHLKEKLREMVITDDEEYEDEPILEPSNKRTSRFWNVPE